MVYWGFGIGNKCIGNVCRKIERKFYINDKINYGYGIKIDFLECYEICDFYNYRSNSKSYL